MNVFVKCDSHSCVIFSLELKGEDVCKERKRKRKRKKEGRD
jgi:hypothetical protein